MTDFRILYWAAALLALSDGLALATIAIWALNNRRPIHRPQFRVVGFTGSSDEALGLEAP